MPSRLSIPPEKLWLLLLLNLLFFTPFLWGADASWQPARIVDVKTTTDARTATWIVNTPIQDEETVCVIRIHFKDKILQGIYTLDKAQAPPPKEWVKHAPVRVRFVGDRMFLKGPAGRDYRLRVISAKSAPAMDPWTAKEIAAEKAAAASEQPGQSIIGFDQEVASPTPQSAPAGQPSPSLEAEKPTGTVSISSTPYLAEIYVDGENMGYTPAKLKLLPGKHTLRCEKSGFKVWTQEVTVTADSELSVEATLPPGRK